MTAIYGISRVRVSSGGSAYCKTLAPAPVARSQTRRTQDAALSGRDAAFAPCRGGRSRSSSPRGDAQAPRSRPPLGGRCGWPGAVPKAGRLVREGRGGGRGGCAPRAGPGHSLGGYGTLARADSHCPVSFVRGSIQPTPATTGSGGGRRGGYVPFGPSGRTASSGRSTSRASRTA